VLGTDSPTTTAEAQVTAARARLLAGARQCFSERGFQGTSIRDIAKACGINSATIYSHFPSKAQLYIEVVEPYLDAVQTTFEAAARSSGTGAERLERMIDATVEVQQRFRDEYVSLLRDWHSIRADAELDHVVERRQAGSARWLDVIQDGIDDGSIRSDVTPHQVQWIIANTAAAVVDDRFAGPPGGPPHVNDRRRALRVVLDGLRPNTQRAQQSTVHSAGGTHP
jgi:AcrR family transcriptional regulator